MRLPRLSPGVERTAISAEPVRVQIQTSGTCSGVCFNDSNCAPGCICSCPSGGGTCVCVQGG